MLSFAQLKISNKEEARFFLQCKGGVVSSVGLSMLPSLPEKCKLKIIPINPINLRIGDIVAFDNGISISIHRLISRFKKQGKLFFFEKGDNNNNVSIIQNEQIIGKVDEVYDENSNLIDSKIWKKEKLPPSTYVFMVCFLYKILGFFKKLIFRKKRIKIVSDLASLYCKLFLNID